MYANDHGVTTLDPPPVYQRFSTFDPRNVTCCGGHSVGFCYIGALHHMVSLSGTDVLLH